MSSDDFGQPQDDDQGWDDERAAAALAAEVTTLRAEIAALHAQLDDPTLFVRRLRDLADQAARNLEVPGARWHAILVPDTGTPEHVHFDAADDLAAYLRHRAGEDLRVFAYYGIRAGIGKGGQFLVTHVGKFSLVTIDDLDEIDDEGYLGRPDAALVLPDSPTHSPARAHGDFSEDEIDDDEDEEGDDEGPE